MDFNYEYVNIVIFAISPGVQAFIVTEHVCRSLLLAKWNTKYDEKGKRYRRVRID